MPQLYSQNRTLTKLDLLLLERDHELARYDLLTFARATLPSYQMAAHLVRLADALETVECGDVRRLLITMPPRHGKSELCSVRFPAWYLGLHPDRRIVLASYAADLAERFSRQVRSVVMGNAYQSLFPSVAIARDSRSVAAWDLSEQRGGMKAVGVGGPLTGHGAHLLIIDDPVKNREEANSAIVRQSIWDWYTSTAYTRLEENAAIVLVMTRWHEDDLMGRLLAAQETTPETDRWTVLHLPAQSESAEPLWPEKYGIDDLARIRANVGFYDWSALYMGRPMPREGGMFRRGWLPISDAAPAVAQRVRYWDKAGTEGGGDWTVGVRMARSDDGLYCVEDVVRGQWSAGERETIIRQTAESDGTSCRIWLEQEGGSGGKESAAASVRNLAGFNVHAEPVTGEKSIRAEPFAAQAEAGNVRLLRGPWNAAYWDEFASFPFGRHDDQVDATSGAFNKLAHEKRVIRAH